MHDRRALVALVVVCAAALLVVPGLMTLQQQQATPDGAGGSGAPVLRGAETQARRILRPAGGTYEIPHNGPIKCEWVGSYQHSAVDG